MMQMLKEIQYELRDCAQTEEIPSRWRGHSLKAAPATGGAQMTDKEFALATKAKGIAAFSAENYQEAIIHFTEAITHDPMDYVLFCNRSACYDSLEQYEKALEDGIECVKLKPEWTK